MVQCREIDGEISRRTTYFSAAIRPLLSESLTEASPPLCSAVVLRKPRNTFRLSITNISNVGVWFWCGASN